MGFIREFISDFKKEINWQQFRKDFKFFHHDLDVENTIWGKKVRASRPLLLFSLGFSISLCILEMQSNNGFNDLETQFYIRQKNKVMPYYYDYLDLKKIR